MSYKIPVLAAAFAAASSSALAQGISGGSLGLEYNVFDGSEVTTYSGGLEYSINRQFGIGLDVTGSSSGSASSSSATLHGIYHLSNSASVGAYYGQSEGDVSFYGIEGGTSWGNTNFGGYIGQRSAGGDTALAFGFNSETPFASNFELYTDFDFVESSGDWVSTDEIGIQYNMNQGPELFAHYGRGSATVGGLGGSTDYFGIGARINFGAARGTTFEAR